VKKPCGNYYAYSKYRSAIAEDCGCRCSYCDNHEDVIGGREATNLDHFRPWNKSFGSQGDKLFKHLKNDPYNLLHSCRPCNGFKLDCWPTEDPDVAFDGEKGWLNPFDVDRREYFLVDPDGTLKALKKPAEYQIKKLRLNRPLMKRLRQQGYLKGRLITLMEQFESKWIRVSEGGGDESGVRTAKEALCLLEAIRELMK